MPGLIPILKGYDALKRTVYCFKTLERMKMYLLFNEFHCVMYYELITDAPAQYLTKRQTAIY